MTAGDVSDTLGVRQPGVVRLGLIQCLPWVAETTFQSHRGGSHGELATAIPGLRHQLKNRTMLHFVLGGIRERKHLDGFSELRIDSLVMMSAGTTWASYRSSTGC